MYFFLPYLAYAKSIDEVLGDALEYVVNPLIGFMMAVAVLVFIWGVAEFLRNQGQESGEAREKGKRHMFYGIIGLLIMVSVFGIMRLMKDTFGLEAPPGGSIDIPKNRQ
jgi:MFS superfamily sulfate permease-like transporter